MYIDLTGRVLTYDQGRWDSIPGRLILKNQKMVHDEAWLNTQHYKVHFKGKVEQSWNGCSTPTPR